MPEVTADPWALGVTMGQQGRSQTIVTNVGNVSLQDRTEESDFPLALLLDMFPSRGAQFLCFLD